MLNFEVHSIIGTLGLLPHTPDWMKTMTLISKIVSAPAGKEARRQSC